MLVQLPIRFLVLNAAIRDLLFLASPTSHQFGPWLPTKRTPTLRLPLEPPPPSPLSTTHQAILKAIPRPKPHPLTNRALHPHLSTNLLHGPKPLLHRTHKIILPMLPTPGFTILQTTHINHQHAFRIRTIGGVRKAENGVIRVVYSPRGKEATPNTCNIEQSM